MRVRTKWLLCGGMIAAIWVVYGRAILYGFVGFDDSNYVGFVSDRVGGLNLANVGWAFKTFTFSNWHPLTWISYLIDRSLFQMNPGGMHAENILLHCACCVFLFLMLDRSTGKSWRSWVVAMLFAVHPVHVESVAWIAERKDVLSMMFLFWSWWVYVKYARGGGVAWYFVMVVLYGASLGSKSMGVTYPFLLLLWDWWPLARRAWGRMILEKVPLLAMSVAICVLTFKSQQAGHSVAGLAALPASVRMANAMISYVHYLVMMAVPVNLTVFYPLRLDYLLPGVLAAGCMLVMVTASVVWLGKSRRYLVVGWLWFLGTLLPTIGLVQVGSQAIADRYLYLPSVGILLMVVWGTADLFQQRAVLRWVAAGTIGGYAWLGWVQVGYWRDQETLFRRALELGDNNWMAHDHLGTVYKSNGDYESAMKEFLKAIELNPGFANGYSDMGNCVYQVKPMEALPFYEKAIEIGPENPLGYIGAGNVYFTEGEMEKARTEYARALELDPESKPARSGLEASEENLRKKASLRGSR